MALWKVFFSALAFETIWGALGGVAIVLVLFLLGVYVFAPLRDWGMSQSNASGANMGKREIQPDAQCSPGAADKE